MIDRSLGINAEDEFFRILKRFEEAAGTAEAGKTADISYSVRNEKKYFTRQFKEEIGVNKEFSKIEEEEKIKKLREAGLITEEDYTKKKDEYAEKRIAIADAEYVAMQGFDELYNSSVAARAAVLSSAYGAMEDQMLSLVETGKFSAAAFAKVVVMQVKTELVGIAAKASVLALYELAAGLMASAWGWPTAPIHFASAKVFGLIAGASLAAAAGVHALTGGSGASAGTGGGAAAGVRTKPGMALPMAANESQQTQNVTIQIYNPLSTQNWAEIAEKNIIPALNDAGRRNISLTIATAEA